MGTSRLLQAPGSVTIDLAGTLAELTCATDANGPASIHRLAADPSDPGGDREKRCAAGTFLNYQPVRRWPYRALHEHSASECSSSSQRRIWSYLIRYGAHSVTHVHAYLVFDTLYGLDETFIARPQMIEGHVVENDGRIWTLRLREGLRFHDSAPVLARDVVASIRRFAARDLFGQSLLAVVSELSAPDDRTVRFRLAKSFPHLPAALAGSSANMPCIMPERLARIDPFVQVTEMVGSGPYRFLPAEFNAGVRTAYERFAAYVPRSEGRQSYTAGPKVTHFDRVEWESPVDAATSVAALLQGEVDWLQRPATDHVPLIARNADVIVEIKEPAGAVGIMRFNQLHPPFDNPAVRRALLGAVDQADVMTVVAGTDRTRWRDRVGLFGPNSPLANEAGIEARPVRVTTAKSGVISPRPGIAESEPLSI